MQRRDHITVQVDSNSLEQCNTQSIKMHAASGKEKTDLGTEVKKLQQR